MDEITRRSGRKVLLHPGSGLVSAIMKPGRPNRPGLVDLRSITAPLQALSTRLCVRSDDPMPASASVNENGSGRYSATYSTIIMARYLLEVADTYNMLRDSNPDFLTVMQSLSLGNIDPSGSIGPLTKALDGRYLFRRVSGSHETLSQVSHSANFPLGPQFFASLNSTLFVAIWGFDQAKFDELGRIKPFALIHQLRYISSLLGAGQCSRGELVATRH